MKKGIVLEVHDEHVTILTPEGEFLKSRKQKGQVDLGEEIVFFPLHRTETAKKGKLTLGLRGKWVLISVMTAIILAFSLYPKYASNQVYAYVSVDVNPSIELGINKDMKVISMEAYNKEGEDIINQLENWEKQDIASVSSQIFDAFRQKGFLTENSEVLIASVLSHETNSDWKTLMQNKITTISEKVQEDKVSITTLETTIEERSDALKEGISPGKYIQKEQKTELVDNEDTSKSEPVPTMPLNQKPLEIKHTNAKEEKSGPPSFVEIKKSEKEAVKKEREEWQEQKKDRQEDRKKEQEDRKIEREQKQEDRKEKRKEEREVRKEKQEERKEKREEEREVRKEKQEDRKEKREEEREDRKEKQEDRKNKSEEKQSDRKDEKKGKDNRNDR
ncbi:anti-sigma factor domain-containing protein [Sutcliffiella horikoshii]|uniref:Anti-sigma factor domain-containing protein n=1 Tax=Sutcliffiella horikoshii TaxID=79883 RepID=A0A5D4T5J8_9BACI|nr:anti-sigma factor domain-containing protein [Sutcliffiella horikoshii]TYS70997.1 anti-sigma factor domain-containing protein [Sutcliffiella horikoshii]